MKKLFTLFLVVFFLGNAFSQYPEWDNYMSISFINTGTETENDVWLLVNSAIIQIDKNTSETKVHHHANAGFGAYVIADIWADSDNILYYVSGHIGYYENRQWYKSATLSLPQNHRIKKIVGKDDSGKLYLLSYNGHIYTWTNEQGAEILSLPSSGSFFDATMDEDGGIWLLNRNWLAYWNDGSFQFQIPDETPNQYLNEIKLGKANGEAWTRGIVDLFYNDGTEWHSIAVLDLFDSTNLSLIVPIAPKTALAITYNNDVFLVRFENGFWETQNITDQFTEEGKPRYRIYFSDNNKARYFNSVGEFWEWKPGEQAVEIKNPGWLNIVNTNSLTLDLAGRIWVTGNNGISYMQGGKWHAWGEVEDEFFDFGVNKIIFSDDLNPTIATGTPFFFGPPPGNILSWSESTQEWKDVDMTGLSFQRQVVNHLEEDQEGNLWAIGGAFQNTLGIRSRGRWFQFRPSDTPLDSFFRFTCLEKDPDGSMWIGTDRGILNYDGFQFTAFDFRQLGLSLEAVRDILVDQKGQVWVTVGYEGVRMWDGETWHTFNTDTSFPERFEAIEEGNNGDIWFALNSVGAIKFDGSEWTKFNYENSGLNSGNVTDIKKDGQGRIWFVGNKGVSVYHPTKNRIPIFELPEGQNIAVFPNPGCCAFQINWQQNEAGKTTIELYNPQGQKVQTILNEETAAGEQQILFKQNNLPVGIYILTVTQSGKTESQLLVIK